MAQVQGEFDILVVGTESSGSVLAARLVANATGIAEWGDWDGYGFYERGMDRIEHVSLPTGIPPKFPKYNVYAFSHVIITTRDNTASIMSKQRRWKKPLERAVEENVKAVMILQNYIQSRHNVYVFSYESLMLLKGAYLSLLYDFLGVECNFIPNVLTDGNVKYFK